MALIVLLSAVLTLAAGNGLLVAAFSCPQKCTCNISIRSVICTKLNLTSPPLDLPKDAVRLDLSINFISDLSAIVNLTSLMYLDLTHNSIVTWKANWLQNLTALKQLKLSQNRLTKPPPGVCSNLPALQNLFLDNNFLDARLPEDYKACAKLTRLTLSDNMFTVIDNTTLCSLSTSQSSAQISIKLNRLGKLTAAGIQPGALACLSKRLISLDLSNNSLPQSSLEALIGGSQLGKLQSLNLKMSAKLAAVTQELLVGAKSLLTLILDGSSTLTSLHSTALAQTPRLNQLSLSRTNISGWNDRCLDQLSHLEKLDLRYTSVTTIGGFNGSDVNSLRQLTDENKKFSLDLTGAALACDCSLYWLTQQLNQPNILARVTNASRLTCAQPAVMRGRRLLDFAPTNCLASPPGFFTAKMIVILASAAAGFLLLLSLATVGVVFTCRRCRSSDGSGDLRDPLVISPSSSSSVASDIGEPEATRRDSVWIRLRRFLRQRREASSQSQQRQRQPIYAPPDPEPEDYLSANTA